MNWIAAVVLLFSPLMTLADLAPVPFKEWLAYERMARAYDETKMCTSVVGPSFMQCFVVFLVMAAVIQVIVIAPRRNQRVPSAVRGFSWLLALVDASFVSWFGRSAHDFYAVHCSSAYGICWLLVHLVWFACVFCRYQPRLIVSAFVVLLWFAVPLCAESTRMLLDATTVHYERPNLSEPPTEAEEIGYRRYIESDREIRKRRIMRRREMREMRERMHMKPTIDSLRE